MTVLVLASNNVKKAREMRALLPAGYDVRTANEAQVKLPEETGSTFEENALIKARAAAHQSGLFAVADDSGLEVDALGGRPGVRSARFAADAGRHESDDENNRLLLELLNNVPDNQRTARFVSAVAIVTPGGDEHVVRGTVEGRIGHEPVGSNGFGYDPLFILETEQVTMAQISAEEKNRISHRSNAFQQAMPYILRLTNSNG